MLSCEVLPALFQGLAGVCVQLARGLVQRLPLHLDAAP
jgi:hypothetical protein